jgi:transcriptional regulator with XRE-family HTH domain
MSFDVQRLTIRQEGFSLSGAAHRVSIQDLMKAMICEAPTMEKLNSQPRTFKTVFGLLLARKRSKAGLSLADLADLTRLSLGFLEELEQGVAVPPNFDVCYKIAQAINSRVQQGFVLQDLWEAAALDKLSRISRAAESKNRHPNDIAPLSKPVEPRAA